VVGSENLWQRQAWLDYEALQNTFRRITAATYDYGFLGVGMVKDRDVQADAPASVHDLIMSFS
jgi:hypothetical protein